MMKVRTRVMLMALAAVLVLPLVPPGALAAPVLGGSVDPTSIPKYVIPLVIPPVMNNNGTSEHYDIAVRQFKQQILPGGIWNTLNGRSDNFDPTTVWSYGPKTDPVPNSKVLGGGAATAPAANSQFNYPAYTVETTSGTSVHVQWINDLVDKNGNYLPHLLPIDQTVHWANPPMECRMGVPRTDCSGINQKSYTGPVPIVTHLHGAHVGPESDGYPEAWWLPAANNIPAGYATHGTLFDDASGSNPGNLGYADFTYPQDQPATTLWYHDHSLGMTRSNVYAGPAGFWLIRGGAYDAPTVSGSGLPAILPGPAPVSGEGVLQVNITDRGKYREIPIVIQDRSFDMNGKQLFYPKNRSFFEGGLEPKDLKIQFAPVTDVLPIWQPEAFFNVMVVNGVAWPEHKVAKALYRLRFLNGCNSRFLWLKFSDPNVKVYQIGAEQGFLPAPVDMNSLDLDGTGDGTAQILMALAERADVIVDFRGLSDGDEVELLNIGPDEPFGGGKPCKEGEDPDDVGCFAPADSNTTGQVMRFVVDDTLTGYIGSTDGSATEPSQLVLNAEGALGVSSNTRKVSLNEKESESVCVLADAITEEYLVPIKNVNCLSVPPAGTIVVPFGPTEALLGTVDVSGAEVTGVPLKWTAEGVGSMKTVTVPSGPVDVWVTENPVLGATEDWEIYNFTADAHPIHLHLVRFQVQGRTTFDGSPSPNGDVKDWELGYKDTVISYPGDITTIRATFDVAGLYVWHCHIVEHEDNEMMRPYFVGP